MTKKRMEMLLSAETPAPSQDSNGANSRLAKDRTNKRTKNHASSSRPLKRLEALHHQTGVQGNLQLPQGGRIKLKHDPDKNPPKPKPVPKFNMDFTQLREELGNGEPRPVDVIALSDSDDDLPDARDFIHAPGTQRAGATSDSTDYECPSLDAIIADLPLADVAGSPAKLPVALGTRSTENITSSLKRKRQEDQSFPPFKEPRLSQERSLSDVRLVDYNLDVNSRIFRRTIPHCSCQRHLTIFSVKMSRR